MRHRKLNKRFGRNKSQREELIRSLVRSLFISCSIKTTLQKAKEARRTAERLITLAKNSTLANIRAIDRVLQDRVLTKRLLQELSPLFKDKNSGYTRIVRSSFRRGDGAPLAVLELTEKPVVEKRPKKKEKPEAPPVEKIAARPDEEPTERRPEKKAVPRKPKERPKKKPEPKKVEEKKPEEKKPAPEKKSLFARIKDFFKKK